MTLASPPRHTQPGAPRGPGRLYAVASGKGGVGKTWFALTLTHVIARSGRRTLLFDGDIGLANVDVQLGLVPRQHLGSVLNGRATLKQAVTTYEDGGFDVLAGLSGSGDLGTLPPSRLAEIGVGLKRLAGEYDATIIDLGAGLDRTVRRLSHLADECIVVTTADPTALTDAYAFIKLMVGDRPETKFGIVVNLAETRAEGERTFSALLKACQSFLKISPSLLGVVRRDRKVADAIRSQTPLITRHPGSDAALDVQAIAARLIAGTE